jgi:hypothetical protein
MDKDVVTERISDMDTQRFETPKHFIKTKGHGHILRVIVGTGPGAADSDSHPRSSSQADSADRGPRTHSR